jgi:zinc protease
MKIIRKPWPALVLLALISITASAQYDPSQTIPLDPDLRIGKLPNGLVYYIRKNTKPEKRVELRLVVNAGSVLEDPDQVGLAHFMEHMNFNGTKRFPKNELVSYLQSIGVEFGADLNAYTGFDETVYILPVPSDKPGLVDKGLQILEDWAHNATLDSVEIDKERGVVIEEWRLGRGPDERMLQKTLPIQYRGSKYAERLPIGTKDNLEHFSHASLQRFYKEWYRPDEQAVIVVGDIDVNDIEQKIKTYFGNIPAPPNPRKRESFPVPDHSELLTVVAKDKEAAFPTIDIMYKKDKESETTVSDYARSVNEQLFTSMLNSRFQELSMHPNPPFIGAGAYYGGTYARTKDAYQLFANVSDTGMARAISSLLEEDRRVQLFGFTDAELDRQKKQMLSLYEKAYSERTKNESASFVNEYVNHFLQGEPTPGIEWEYSFLKNYLPSVKKEDINRLAALWLTKNNMVVTANAPDKAGIRIPTDDEIKNIINDVETASLKPYEEKAVATELLDRSKLKSGKLVQQVKNEKLGTTTLTFSNGATVILKPTDFKNDEIIVRAFSKGGNSVVNDADYYSATNAAQIVQQSGVGDFSRSDLGKVLKGRNTNFSTTINYLTESINGNTTPKDVETLLQLIHLYFTAPRKDPDAFASYVTRQKQLYQNLAADPQNYFYGELQKILTQNHLRGGQLPKPEDLDKVNFDKAMQIYKERFGNAGDFTFFFVGSFDVNKMIPLLETYIGGLPSSPKRESFIDRGIRPPVGPLDKVIKKGSEPQSQVNIIFTGDTKYDSKESYALQSLGDVLSITLIEKLREEIGGVYGIGASGSIGKLPHPTYTFYIGFPCAPENIEKLTKAAVAEVEKIQKNGVSAANLEKVKEQQKRKLEVDIKQNQFWIDNLYNSYVNSNNPEDILKKQEQINSLNSKMMQDAANKYLNLKKYIRIYLLPEKTEEKPKAF